MKKVISAFGFILLISATAFAQTVVQITNGRFDLIAETPPYMAGTAIMQSEVFTSNSSLNSYSSPWGSVCPDFECNPGDSFTMPNGLFIGDNGHRFGSFTINGTTYENAYFSRSLQFEEISFQIPRIYRRKGLIYFHKTFKMDGSLKVCRIDDFANGCPQNDILFEGFIAGHGDLTVTMRVRLIPFFDRSIVYLQPVKYEYQFKP